MTTRQQQNDETKASLLEHLDKVYAQAKQAVSGGYNNFEHKVITVKWDKQKGRYVRVHYRPEDAFAVMSVVNKYAFGIDVFCRGMLGEFWVGEDILGEFLYVTTKAGFYWSIYHDDPGPLIQALVAYEAEVVD